MLSQDGGKMYWRMVFNLGDVISSAFILFWVLVAVFKCCMKPVSKASFKQEAISSFFFAQGDGSASKGHGQPSAGIEDLKDKRVIGQCFDQNYIT